MQVWNSRRTRYLFEDITDGFLVGLGFLGALALLVLAILILGIPIMILQGWVLTLLWGWFAVPLFGLPPLSLAPAIGLMVLVRFFLGDYLRPMRKSGSEQSWNELSWHEKREKKREIVTGIVVGICLPFVFLLTGYIIHLFM